MQQDFYRNNTLPGESKPQRPFDVWAARQDSTAGRFERNRKNQQELDRSHMLTQSEAEQAKPKAKGKKLGGLKDLNE